MRYRHASIAYLEDIEIRFVPGEEGIEVWFFEKDPKGRVVWLKLKMIKDMEKLYEGLKKYGFKLPEKENFKEKFSKIIEDYRREVRTIIL